jgi:RimJ/RimL family protein N-acetyltransferase
MFETDRLALRPPLLRDAARIQKLAGAREVAQGTLVIPHPYPDGAAEAFIDMVAEEITQGTNYNFAMVLRSENALIGMIGLTIEAAHHRAEMGYWVGVPYWNNGYATEAARRMVQFGFEELKLNRIMAACFTWNTGSARVMQKAGMTYEGTLRQHLERFGTMQDIALYGILREEYAHE